MEKKACYYLGKIVSKYSFKGELLIRVETDDINSLVKLKKFFIEVDNSLIPFFIKKCSVHKSSLLRVKFEDVDTEIKANELLKKNIYLPKKLLPKLNGDKYYFHEIINFEIIDNKIGNIGVVIGFNTQTIQSLIEVKTADKKILIPVHDDIILNVDKKNKLIITDLPEGLMDLF
tara:strand:+ start:85 stop:606 length:522 start_codon:yes stop_codon:yes gene_type:complete